MTASPLRRDSHPVAAPRRKRFPLAWPLTLAAAAAVVALAAQIAIPVPGSPVPITLQGLAVLLVGGLFGSAIAGGAMVLYLLAGAFGLPVFAPLGAPGIARLLGPTGGYLVAFPFAAMLVGYIGARRHPGRCLFAALAGMALIHLGGWAQLTLLTGDTTAALRQGLMPFLLQDLLKALLAALILWRGHLALRLRS